MAEHLRDLADHRHSSSTYEQSPKRRRLEVVNGIVGGATVERVPKPLSSSALQRQRLLARPTTHDHLPFTRLPFRLILDITREYFELDVPLHLMSPSVHPPSDSTETIVFTQLDYVGRFALDRCRTPFVLFWSLRLCGIEAVSSPGLTKPLRYYTPFQVWSVDFCFPFDKADKARTDDDMIRNVAFVGKLLSHFASKCSTQSGRLQRMAVPFELMFLGEWVPQYPPFPFLSLLTADSTLRVLEVPHLALQFAIEYGQPRPSFVWLLQWMVRSPKCRLRFFFTLNETPLIHIRLWISLIRHCRFCSDVVEKECRLANLRKVADRLQETVDELNRMIVEACGGAGCDPAPFQVGEMIEWFRCRLPRNQDSMWWIDGNGEGKEEGEIAPWMEE